MMRKPDVVSTHMKLHSSGRQPLIKELTKSDKNTVLWGVRENGSSQEGLRLLTWGSYNWMRSERWVGEVYQVKQREEKLFPVGGKSRYRGFLVSTQKHSTLGKGTTASLLPWAMLIKEEYNARWVPEVSGSHTTQGLIGRVTIHPGLLLLTCNLSSHNKCLGLNDKLCEARYRILSLPKTPLEII